jgi:hypothetical protein
MKYTEAVNYVSGLDTHKQYRMVVGPLATHTWLQSQPSDSPSIFIQWDEEMLVNSDDVEMFLNVWRNYNWSVMRYVGLAGSTTFRIRPIV